MADWKLLADLVTVLRVVMGIGIVWLGWRYGQAALPLVTVVMLACWTGDYLDGSLARRARPARSNWLGEHDVFWDIIVSLCLGAYLVLAGWVSWKFALGYLFAWAVVFWAAGANHALMMLVQAPIYGWFLLVALWQEPQVGRWVLLWIGLMLAFNWPRFTRQVVPGFLSEMHDAWLNWRTR